MRMGGAWGMLENLAGAGTGIGRLGAAAWGAEAAGVGGAGKTSNWKGRDVAMNFCGVGDDNAAWIPHCVGGFSS